MKLNKQKNVYIGMIQPNKCASFACADPIRFTFTIKPHLRTLFGVFTCALDVKIMQQD